MSNYQSVIDFAQKVKTLDRVDGVIENAGITLPKWTVGDKGVETTIIVNVTHISVVGSAVGLQEDARDELNKVPENENIIQYFSDESNGFDYSR